MKYPSILLRLACATYNLARPQHFCFILKGLWNKQKMNHTDGLTLGAMLGRNVLDQWSSQRHPLINSFTFRDSMMIRNKTDIEKLINSFNIYMLILIICNARTYKPYTHLSFTFYCSWDHTIICTRFAWNSVTVIICYY